LKEIKVLIEGFFMFPKKNNKGDSFVDVKVDEKCLWLALQY
jgi:hypothetical protein